MPHPDIDSAAKLTHGPALKPGGGAQKVPGRLIFSTVF
jgi:hypothetical protein